MLRKLVEQDLVQFENEFDTWQDAVKASYDTMLKQNIVENAYIDQVIKSIEQYGPYIVLLPNVAMPHASQGAVGVNKSAIAFMKVEKAVVFEEDNREKDAQLFFALAALDASQHLENITQLSELLMNEDVVEALKYAKNKDDLLAIADKFNL